MEDVLVKVDKFIFKFIFPTDFIILDMEEDREVLIILGRPFLTTGRTLIDVQKRELTMRVQDQEVTFNVFKVMKFPKESDECFMVDNMDKCTDDKMSDAYFSDPLENTIVNTTCGKRLLILKSIYMYWTRHIIFIVLNISLRLWRSQLVRTHKLKHQLRYHQH